MLPEGAEKQGFPFCDRVQVKGHRGQSSAKLRAHADAADSTPAFDAQFVLRP